MPSESVLSRTTHEPRPYRLIVKIKNNRLWTRIREMFPEIRTVKDAAGSLEVSYRTLIELLNMRVHPWSEQRQWSPSAIKIADRLAETCDYLFDPLLYGREPVPTIELTCGPRELADHGLLQLPPAPDAVVEQYERRQAIQQALSTLTARESMVLTKRFGLDGNPPETLEEIGRANDVTRNRIRQIEFHALCKLRRPDRSRFLQQFVEP